MTSKLFKAVKFSFLATCIGATFGCATGKIVPDLYPNALLQSKTKTEVDADITSCNELAGEYVHHSDEYTKAAKESGEGAVIGSAAGALGGVIVGSNVGRSLGAGAAVGAIVPLLQRAFQSNEPSPNVKRFVELCLSDRGYQVL